MTDVHESAPDAGSIGLNLQNFDELEAQMEELFDKADHLMIHLKKYSEAVSLSFFKLIL